MNKAVLMMVGSGLGLVLSSAVIAQSEPSESKTPEQVKAPLDLAPKGYMDSQAGLQVEERRYENRLDGVMVERDSNRVRDYYNLSDPDIERRDGGIAELPAQRTWRFGGGR